MQIVIDIPDNEYILVKNLDDFHINRDNIVSYVRNGIPLPKRHGDLIDKESLVKAIEQKAKRLKNLDTINGLCGAVALVYEAETVIEADKEV